MMAPSQPAPEIDPNAWEGSTMLHVYMYDYCRKRNFHAAAEALAKQTGIAPSHKVPIDAPQGLLFEWWSVFWEIFTSRTPSAAGHGSRHDDAATYNKHLDMRQAATEMAATLQSRSRSSSVAGPSSAPAQTPSGNNASLPVVPLTSSGAGLARVMSSPGKPMSAHQFPQSPQGAASNRSMSRTSSFTFKADPRTPEKQGSSSTWGKQATIATTSAQGAGQDLASRLKAPSKELITNVMRSLGWGDRDAATLSLDERNKLMTHVRQVQLAQARAQMQMAQAQMLSSQQGKPVGQDQATGASQAPPAQGRALQSPFAAPVDFPSPTQNRTPMDLKRPLEDDGKPAWQVAPGLRPQQQQGTPSGLGLQPSPMPPGTSTVALYASPDAQRRNLEEHAQLARQLQQQSQSILQSEQRERRPQTTGDLGPDRSPQTPAQPPTPRTPQSAASLSFAEAQSQVSQQIQALQQGRNQAQMSWQISRLQKLQGLISQSQNSAAAAEDQHLRNANGTSTGAAAASRQLGLMAPPPASPQGQGPGAFMAASGPPPSPSHAQVQMAPPPPSPHHPQPISMQQQQQIQLQQHLNQPSLQHCSPQGQPGQSQRAVPSQGPMQAHVMSPSRSMGPSVGPPAPHAPSASASFPSTELFGGNLIQSLPTITPGPIHGGMPGHATGMPASGHFTATPNFELNPSPFAGFDFGAPPPHHHQGPHPNGAQGAASEPGRRQDPRPGAQMMMVGPGMHGGGPPQFASHQPPSHGPPGFHDPAYDFVMQRH